jgi:predicted transcriptional regulator
MNNDHVKDVISNRFNYVSKIEQIDVILHLLSKQKNLIFIVKTEFDKSIIFQATSLMYSAHKIALIIMSLKALKT